MNRLSTMAVVTLLSAVPAATDCTRSSTSVHAMLFHASPFATSPASKSIAVESCSVDITAAMLSKGLPLYRVISRAPLKDPAVISPMLMAVLLPEPETRTDLLCSVTG